MLLKIREGTPGLELRPLKLGELLSSGEGFREGLSVKFLELGLPIEGLELGWTARHAEENDPLRFHRNVGFLENAMPVIGLGFCCASALLQHRQGDPAHAISALVEEGATAVMW